MASRLSASWMEATATKVAKSEATSAIISNNDFFNGIVEFRTSPDRRHRPSEFGGNGVAPFEDGGFMRKHSPCVATDRLP
jgi:hypothetical protein